MKLSRLLLAAVLGIILVGVAVGVAYVSKHRQQPGVAGAALRPQQPGNAGAALRPPQPRGILTLPSGATYYVALTGADSNPGTLAQPFATINHGVSLLHPGDTLYIRGGTYNEALLGDIPSGTSWSAPVTVAAYSGEAVTLRTPAGSYRGIDLSGSFSYIHILNLTLDGSQVTAPGVDGIKISHGNANEYAHDILVSGCDIGHYTEQGILITSDPSIGDPVNNNQIINCNIHHNGAL